MDKARKLLLDRKAKGRAAANKEKGTKFALEDIMLTSIKLNHSGIVRILWYCSDRVGLVFDIVRLIGNPFPRMMRELSMLVQGAELVRRKVCKTRGEEEEEEREVGRKIKG
ncbi:60S ribosomal protein L26-1 [Spatholobus suberectus]|nr:60S ribosomal protein L26-1 [Spatholobus suberectus]